MSTLINPRTIQPHSEKKTEISRRPKGELCAKICALLGAVTFCTAPYNLQPAISTGEARSAGILPPSPAPQAPPRGRPEVPAPGSAHLFHRYERVVIVHLYDVHDIIHQAPLGDDVEDAYWLLTAPARYLGAGNARCAECLSGLMRPWLLSLAVLSERRSDHARAEREPALQPDSGIVACCPPPA